MAKASPPSPLPRERGGAVSEAAPSSHLTPQRGGADGDAAPPSPGRRGAGGEVASVFSRGPGMTARARMLRRDMTEAERRLWSLLRGDALGVRFRRQLVIDRRFIVDFCAPEIGLVVEVDGGQHAGSESDLIRDAYLAKRGYSVLRFWNNEVLNETLAVMERILAVVSDLLEAKASPPAPLRDGEGGAAAMSVPGFVRGVCSIVDNCDLDGAATQKRILNVTSVSSSVLCVTFDDGAAREVDFSDVISTSKWFRMLSVPTTFETVEVVNNGRALQWITGADFCADALRIMADEQLAAKGTDV
jgi:very-short-patch-repair endonuclease